MGPGRPSDGSSSTWSVRVHLPFFHLALRQGWLRVCGEVSKIRVCPRGASLRFEAKECFLIAAHSAIAWPRRAQRRSSLAPLTYGHRCSTRRLLACLPTSCRGQDDLSQYVRPAGTRREKWLRFYRVAALALRNQISDGPRKRSCFDAAGATSERSASRVSRSVE